MTLHGFTDDQRVRVGKGKTVWILNDFIRFQTGGTMHATLVKEGEVFTRTTVAVDRLVPA